MNLMFFFVLGFFFLSSQKKKRKRKTGEINRCRFWTPLACTKSQFCRFPCSIFKIKKCEFYSIKVHNLFLYRRILIDNTKSVDNIWKVPYKTLRMTFALQIIMQDDVLCSQESILDQRKILIHVFWNSYNLQYVASFRRQRR